MNEDDLDLIQEATDHLEMITNDFVERVLDTIGNQEFISEKQRQVLVDFVESQRNKHPH